MREKSFRYKTIIVFALLLTGYKSFCQITNVVPPAPNAMKMTEYYAQRPNMYTGTANVSIPLYTIDFDGWKLPLSISYNATGVRANEEASEVGLGWALNATAVISRTIRGGDDFLQESSSSLNIGYVNLPRKLVSNMGFNDMIPTWAVPSDTSLYFYLASGTRDTQPDIFNYNFFGYSGSFIMSQRVADPVNHKIKPIKITQDACSILFDEPSMTFSVITPDGYRGDFTITEKSTTFSSAIATDNKVLCCGQNNIDIDQMLHSSGMFRTNTSWYVSKITSPRNQYINFNYDLNVVGAGDNLGSTYAVGSTYSPYLSNTRSFGEQLGPQDPVACIQTVQEHVYLKDIVYKGYDSIAFSMETREDLRRNYLFTPDSISRHEFPTSQFLKRYNGITIIGLDPSSTLNKKITFTQHYFNQQYQDPIANNQLENEVRWLRSRLDRMTIDDQEYQFSYDNGASGIPHKFTRGIDHFGFYNGLDTNPNLFPPVAHPDSFGRPVVLFQSSLTLSDSSHYQLYDQHPNRKVDFNYGRAGLLTKVKYPTRGYSVFDYEPHAYILTDTIGLKFYEYFETSAGNLGGGARIKTIKDYDFNDSLQLSKSYLYVVDPVTNPTTTSGVLMTPLFNRYTQHMFNPDTHTVNGFSFRYKSFATIPGNNSAEGKVIGYSVVHENVIGKDPNGKPESYRNTYHFENRPNTVLQFNLAVKGYPNLNGQSTDIQNYNSNGQLIQREQNLDIYHPLGDITGIVYEPGATGGTGCCYMGYHAAYSMTKTFVTPFTIITTSTADRSNGIPLLANGKTDSTGNVTQVIKTLGYNKNYLLRYETETNSDGDVVTTEHKRAADYTSPSTMLQYMTDSAVNLVNPVIEEIVTKGGVVISAHANIYALQNNFVNVISSYSFNTKGSFVYSSDGTTFNTIASPNFPYELKASYTKYDSITDKLLEYTTSDGVTNSFVWGYSGTLPIVHGLGVGYHQLLQAYNSAYQTKSTYESTLRGSLPGAQITTYKHNPEVGIARVTDPTGIKKSFAYDTYSRLLKVFDNDSNTVEQYAYHFRERPLTKLLGISGNVDFGTLTPDMYAPKFILQYVKCSDALLNKTITFTNTGEDDLTVNSIALPHGFISSWNGGTISPGQSIPAVLSFDGSMPLNNYSGAITINSDKTNAIPDPTVSVNYAARDCNHIDVSPSLLDFGTITDSFASKPFTVTNNGNAVINLKSISLTGSDFTAPVVVSSLQAVNCINVGESKTVYVNFTPTGHDVPVSTQLSLTFDECPTIQNAIQVQGMKHELRSILSMDTTPINFGSFTQASVATTLTITNTGDLGFDLLGFSFSDPSVAANFSLTVVSTGKPLTFPYPPLDPGASIQLTLTLTPTGFDQNISTDLTFSSDAMTGATTMVHVSGNRYRSESMQLSASSLVFDLSGPSFTPQTVTINAQGNSTLNITGASYADAPNNPDWDVSLVPASNMVQGNQTTISVSRKSARPNPLSITINSDENTGVGVNNILQVSAFDSHAISVSPSSLTFSSTDPSMTQQLTVTNAGASPLTINGLSFSQSSSMFSVMPNSFPVTLGTDASTNQATFTIAFTPPAFNFDPQPTTLTINSDATTGTNTLAITAQRISVRTISLSLNQLTFNSANTIQTVTVTNTGNDYVPISGTSFLYGSTVVQTTPDWSATIPTVTLAPSDPPIQLSVRLLTTTPTEPVSVQVLYNINSTAPVQLSAFTTAVKVPASVNFTSFTSSSTTQAIALSNSGNTSANITKVVSNDSRFAFPGATSFSIPANGNYSFNVTYTPNAGDYTAVTALITFTDSFGSEYSAEVTAKQDPLPYGLTLSPTSLTVKASAPDPSAIITNTGGQTAVINSVPPTSPSGFAVTYYQFTGGIFVPVNPNTNPVTLQHGGEFKITATTCSGCDYSSTNGSITIFDSKGNSYVLNLVRSPSL